MPAVVKERGEALRRCPLCGRWHIVIAFVLAILLCLISSPPAAAQSAEEYFQISYEPFILSKTEVHGDEVFYVTVQGNATCIKDLPMSVSEARITGRVIAEHAESGTRVTLNSSYTTTIKPFPDRAGETIAISRVIRLQFPAQSEPGDYDIILKIDEAEIKVFLWWVDVTNDLPQEQLTGSLKYIPEDESPTPTLTPTPTATPTPASQTGLGTGTWVGIAIAIIISIALALAIWLIKRRKNEKEP